MAAPGRRCWARIPPQFGEDPIATFVGKGEDREGRERRMPDIPAEVQDGSAFETIDRDALREKLPAFYKR